MIEHLEILVEEPSAEAILRALLPRFLADVTFEVYPHEGKRDLLRKLPSRLRGYAKWLPEHVRIIVLVDRDDDDCRDLKQRLEETAEAAGVATRSRNANHFAVVNRIAIEELEAWYFGDWNAVRDCYPKVSAAIPSNSKYRSSDSIAGGTWEAFERVLQRSGYMTGGLRKIEAARAIGERMTPATNTSPSFRAFWAAVTESTGA